MRAVGVLRVAFLLFLAGCAWAGGAPNVLAQGAGSSPVIARSISDVTAILDSEKPDPAKVAKLRAEAEVQPRAGTGRADMARFLYDRCQARATLGDYRRALADCEQAVDLARGSLDLVEYGRILQGLALQYAYVGEAKKSLDTWLRSARELNVQGSKGMLFSAYRNIAQYYISFGDLRQAQVFASRNSALLAESQDWINADAWRRAWWTGEVERTNAALYEARGQLREAEEALRRNEAAWARTRTLVRPGPKNPEDQAAHAIDLVTATLGTLKARQGRMAEGEADVRRALLNRLKVTGKYNLQTSRYIGMLATLLLEQGRLADAEKLALTLLDINKVLGVPEDATYAVVGLSRYASILNLQGRWAEAAKAYDDLDRATATLAPGRREQLTLSLHQIEVLYATNNLQRGLAAAERLLQSRKSRFGESHVDTAMARGVYAIGLARAGRDADAEREFKLAMPILASGSRDTDLDDTLGKASEDQRLALVVEEYIGLLARRGAPDAAQETFRLADLIRGRSVQNALAASSARAVAKNPALAALARKEQDLDRQLVAQLALLNGALALPAGERDDKAVAALGAGIDKLRKAREQAKRDLGSRFREYANLVEPQPATVEDVRKALAPDEAFVSFYFGRASSFVWAVAPDGTVRFKPVPLTAGELYSKVSALRAPFTDQSRLPPFDVALAHSLYVALLQPVEDIWRPAKTIAAATNGALGMLPISLLPTAPHVVGDDKEGQPNSRYRDVPWLVRTHAVSMVPSGASLRQLRQLPPASPKRDPLVGFGDPYFTQEQADEAEGRIVVTEAASDSTVRSTRKRRALRRSGDQPVFADLLRLPDTGDELKSIALALGADPARALYLGRAANERNIKSIDLTRYRFVAFATHGLVPDQLGLIQPAIALTAPTVAKVDGDGLLTMEEVLSLKLDADWVVLSACNSAAGATEGAEALSGLGRAFFYAGTRALLVTNWEVDSLSARDLVTATFANLAQDPQLTRAEALRRAMVGLMDGPGLAGPGGYTYAHPYFWAPYSTIGDGGSAR